jgi:hypothetical protein
MIDVLCVTSLPLPIVLSLSVNSSHLSDISFVTYCISLKVVARQSRIWHGIPLSAATLMSYAPHLTKFGDVERWFKARTEPPLAVLKSLREFAATPVRICQQTNRQGAGGRKPWVL